MFILFLFVSFRMFILALINLICEKTYISDGIWCCYRNMRFRGRSQQDSHELFRALLDGIRTEEADVSVYTYVSLLRGGSKGQAGIQLKRIPRNLCT